MKSFTLLFSLYFFALVILPCRDCDHSKDKNNLEVSIQQNSSSTESCHEICSPLCACNCCGDNITLFMPEGILILKNQLKNNKNHLPDNFSCDTVCSIWQPPKTS